MSGYQKNIELFYWICGSNHKSRGSWWRTWQERADIEDRKVRRRHNPEELVEEEADAPAEGRVVLSVDVGLVQRDQAKDLHPWQRSIATRRMSFMVGSFLRRAEEEDDAAGVPWRLSRRETSVSRTTSAGSLSA